MRRRGKLALLTSATALTSALGLVLTGPDVAAAQGTHGGAHGKGTHAGTHHHGHGHWGHHRPTHPHPPTDPSDPPTDPTGPTDPTDPGDPGEPMACMALYNVTSESDSGFEGMIEVMNHGTTPMEGWTVTWTPGLDTEITGVDGGVLAQNDDGTVTVTNTESNATIPADDEVTFDFTADSTGNNFPVGSISCTSP